MKVLAALVLALVLLPASPAGAQGPPGSLTLLGCRATAPAPSGCADESSLSGTAGVAFAPDGKDVYVAARNPGTLLGYARAAATGVLVRTACFSGTDAPGCTTVPPLAGA